MSKTTRYRGIAIAAFVAAAWVGASYGAAERGTPICISKMRVASRESVIHQGAWSYMLNKEPSERATRGEEGQYYNPTSPIDRSRVDAFLRERPGCCIVHPLNESESLLTRLSSRAMFPNIVFVEVKARPQLPIYYGDHYKVDACWENLVSR